MREKGYKDNYLSHSIDNTKRRQNKKLEIIIEENNSINHDINNPDMSETKTQENKYNNYSTLQPSDSSEKNKNLERRKKINEKMKQIMKYRQNLDNSDQEDSEEKQFYKNEENSDKKKRNRKVNQNLELLKLIKEKFSNSGKKEKERQSEEKKDKEIEEEKVDNRKNNENNNAGLRGRNKYLKRKGFASFIINKKTDDEENYNYNDENKRSNKFKKRDFDISQKEEEKIEEIEKNSKSNSRNRNNRVNNSKNKNHSNIVSVTYPSFMRKGVGNFQISTPKLKMGFGKNEEKEKEKEKEMEKEKEKEIKNEQEKEKENKNKLEDKYTEIPNEQRDKLTINIKPKNVNSMNDSNHSSSKKSNQNNSSNKKNNYTYDRDDDINIKDIHNNHDIVDSYKQNDEYNNEEHVFKQTNIKSKDRDSRTRNKKANAQEYKNNTPDKFYRKNIDSNKSIDELSSKKEGALKILELLKAKKREQQNKSELRAKSQDVPLKQEKSDKNIYNEDDEEKIKDKDKTDNQKGKSITNDTDSVNISSNQQKTTKNSEEGKLDTNSLPKKTLGDEEDEYENENDRNYKESNNKRQQQESNRKENFNRIENRRKVNIMNRSMNINNYLDLDEAQNGRERILANYTINSSTLRTKYNRKGKESNNTNDSINVNKSPDPKNLRTQNTIVQNNLNVKSLDKSFDNAVSRKSPISKRLLNINNNNDKYNSIEPNSNTDLYQPNKMASPTNERNLNNNLENINSTKNINKRIYSKINNNKAYMAYIKKSPGRFKRANPANYNSNDNNKNDKNNSKKNNLFKNYVNNNINNNNANTKIYNNKNNLTGLLEVSSIDKFNTSKDTCISNTLDNINNNNSYNDKKNKNNNSNIKSNLADINQKENSMMFNLEDLMVLEERLNDLSLALQSNNNIENKCFNFWNYYYNCSLYKILEKIFPNEEDSNIVRLSINYELMSIMVCYEFSFHAYITYEDLYLLLLDLVNLNHNNLMIICEYILTKISPENRDNIWVLKLQELVNNLKISQVKELNNNYSLSPIQKINNNTNNLIPKIKNILENYSTEFSPLLKKFLISLESKTYEEINDFFRLNILRVNNFEGSIVASSYLKEKKNFEPIPAPYITEPNKKKYTLVLDLDETLVNFKIKSTKEGMLRARPFLFAFLEEMGVYYELIIWTSATEAYANTLLDAIESEKAYFDYVFYREHAIIVDHDFVKDLTRIGRPLDKVIIVDDMPQNFRLQRQNGITIKPFLGDDNNDMALYHLLPILKHIAEEGNDVRVELAKYRDEIVKKITSNISKHNI